jgi:hypothetical protein
LRVIPRAEGGSEITLGVGSADGVAANQVGDLILNSGNRVEGGRFLITQVFKRSATAKTNAPANQVSAVSRAVVKVPK